MPKLSSNVTREKFIQNCDTFSISTTLPLNLLNMINMIEGVTCAVKPVIITVQYINDKYDLKKHTVNDEWVVYIIDENPLDEPTQTHTY